MVKNAATHLEVLDRYEYFIPYRENIIPLYKQGILKKLISSGHYGRET